eukprot:15366544-Ditylum_brightwellii.AAC.2
MEEMGPVMLLSDINSDIMEGDLSSFLSNTGMYDLSTTLHGIDSTETYIKGHLTLDYAFGTMELISLLKRIQWLVYHFMTFLDHRGIILDFDTQHLSRGEVYRIKDKYLNQVSTKHYGQSVTYRQEVIIQIQQKKIGERTKQLIKDEETTKEKIEKLDKEVTKIML